VAELGPKLPVRLVAAIALASGLTPLNSTMLSVVLRPLGAAFDRDEATLTRALVTSYLVTCIVMQAPGGKLGDRLGHRRALLFGQAAFALAALAGLLAPSLGWLVAARVVMASAGALIIPSATALLRTELPAELRGRAFGAFGATMALSAALGPLVGGQLTSALGWRAVFAVNLVLLPISALLAGKPGRATPSPARAPRARFDVLGSVLLGGALASLALGVGRDGTPNVGLLMAAPVLLALFVVVEKRHPAPIVDLSILRVPTFVASGFIIALHNLAMYALLFELPAICGIVLHEGAHRTGLLLAAVLAPMVVLSPIAGRLTDKVGPRSVALCGTSLAAAGMAVLAFTPLRTLEALIPGLLVFGVGLGLSSAPAQSAGMSAIAVAQSGMAAGLLATLRYLGGVAGTLILSVLLVSSDIDAALAAHRSVVFVFLAALVAAVACAFALPTAQASEKAEQH
jgi:EmrB/QacA subfamily drug resistance transporter